MTETTDFLIIGGGVIGLQLALGLKQRYPSHSVMLLEKEDSWGNHGSGRNSGVLHAGFYYSANSLKARFCQEGNHAMRDYCLTKHLPIRPCGKLVVAHSPADWPSMEELYQRGQKQGVPLQLLDEQQTRQLEPRARTVGKALFSPDTAIIDPLAMLASFVNDAHQAGIQLRLGERFVSWHEPIVHTQRSRIAAGYVINAAGLHADQVARHFGFSQEYAILPFKGLYLYSSDPQDQLSTLIYPVPDLGYPFLGVHFTLTLHGQVKIGPTAIPAFGREQYHGLNRLKPLETLDIALRMADLWLHQGASFRRLAAEELGKYRKKNLIAQAARLVPDIRPASYRHWGKPGIRAQLVHHASRHLEMDFLYQGDAHSFHVLNAVSPGFTCAIPFSRHLLDQLEILANP